MTIRHADVFPEGASPDSIEWRQWNAGHVPSGDIPDGDLVQVVGGELIGISIADLAALIGGVVQTFAYTPAAVALAITDPTTVTAHAEAAGLINADADATGTLVMPTDAEIEVKCLALHTLIEGLTFNGGATTLHCRIYVDQQDAGHRLFDISATGDPTNVVLEVIESDSLWDTLTDGAPHTYYVFLWADAGTIDIAGDTLRFLLAVGQRSSSAVGACVVINAPGRAQINLHWSSTQNSPPPDIEVNPFYPATDNIDLLIPPAGSPAGGAATIETLIGDGGAGIIAQQLSSDQISYIDALYVLVQA